jgi:hypothetical protein
MKRLCAFCLTLILLLANAACERKAQFARQIIALIDVSASIEPEAQQSAFQSVENIAATLRRGDSLVVIPITGDAGNESQGRILRLTLAERREAYDQDLRRAASGLRHSLEATRAATIQDPGAHTDILGALRLAAEEMQLAGGGGKTIILILSDLIQDDAKFNFKSDPALKRDASSRLLASTSARRAGLSFHGVPIFLGLLRSRDIAHVSPQRRLGIEAFWLEFLKDSGAAPVLAEDGPGLLPPFLAGERARQDLIAPGRTEPCSIL